MLGSHGLGGAAPAVGPHGYMLLSMHAPWVSSNASSERIQTNQRYDTPSHVYEAAHKLFPRTGALCTHTRVLLATSTRTHSTLVHCSFPPHSRAWHSHAHVVSHFVSQFVPLHVNAETRGRCWAWATPMVVGRDQRKPTRGVCQPTESPPTRCRNSLGAPPLKLKLRDPWIVMTSVVDARAVKQTWIGDGKRARGHAHG